jgi:hypothetical protein
MQIPGEECGVVVAAFCEASRVHRNGDDYGVPPFGPYRDVLQKELREQWGQVAMTIEFEAMQRAFDCPAVTRTAQGWDTVEITHALFRTKLGQALRAERVVVLQNA